MHNNKMQAFHRQFQKTFHKFTNYTKNQKIFTIFLFVFAFVLVVFPLVKVKQLETQSVERFWLIGATYWKSMVIIFTSMIFLIGWNINTRFKGFVVNFLGFRESEPMLNFIFLWVIASAFMGILDTLNIITDVAGTVSFTRGGWLMLFLLLVGLVISFVEVWKGASKNSQRTKILNIADDEAPKKQEAGKKMLQHLFEDEDFEG